jgi:quercetin dioxygenase-like cupin family protein/DNA-binding XRE family transcriptional regulator
VTNTKQVGGKIKSIRELRKISIAELAERAGMTEDLITLIEDGRELPSLSPLIKIARSLGVRLGTFIDDMEVLGPVISRKGELRKGISFSTGGKGFNPHLDFHPLAGDKSARHMEPFIVEIEPSAEPAERSSGHEGEEFLHVLSGEIEIHYGKDKHVLSQGDSIYFDSVVKHTVWCRGPEPARFLAVVYAPF